MRGKIFIGCVTAAINLEGDGPMESVTKVCSKPVIGLGCVPIRGGVEGIKKEAFTVFHWVILNGV